MRCLSVLQEVFVPHVASIITQLTQKLMLVSKVSLASGFCAFIRDIMLLRIFKCHYRQDAAKRQTAGIKFTHRPKIRFSPHRGDSLHRFTSNLAGPTGTWVRLAVQNFTSIATGWECGPQNIKNFHFLVKSRPDFENF